MVSNSASNCAIRLINWQAAVSLIDGLLSTAAALALPARGRAPAAEGAPIASTLMGALGFRSRYGPRTQGLPYRIRNGPSTGSVRCLGSAGGRHLVGGR
eukprot:6213843-Pleurochrysis_carterae.AAC.1